MLEFALSQETARTAPLLPPVEGREENLLFILFLFGPAVPTSQRKSNFLFLRVLRSMDNSVRRPASSLSPTTHFASSQESTVRGRHSSPHTSGQSRLGPREFCEDASERTAFCTIHPYSLSLAPPQVRRLCRWSRLHSVWRRGSCCPACLAGSRAQFDSATQFSSPGDPPKFNGILETSVAVRNAPVLREEIAVLLAKDAIEPVPPAEMRQGFYGPYFIVPKKVGGLRPILDLRVLNRALHKLPFKMLTHRCMIKCIQPQDWFAIDLKDAYFHVSILPRHRPFLRFAFNGRAWQHRVLPFGLSLSPRVFTKVVEGALTPLREVGIRILNYLDDWLILAQSREQLGDHRDLVLRHLSQLGLRVNWENSNLSPVQRISFLDLELDSVSMTARLTEECAQAVLNCLSSFRGRNVVPLKPLYHCSHAARIASYETTSALATLPGPEVGMAPRLHCE